MFIIKTLVGESYAVNLSQDQTATTTTETDESETDESETEAEELPKPVAMQGMKKRQVKKEEDV